MVLEHLYEIIDLKRLPAEGGTNFYDMDGQYAYIGEKEIEYEIINSLQETKRIECWQVLAMKNDPGFEDVRNKEAF